MRTAMVVGGAESMIEDLTAARALGEYDSVVACNDAGTRLHRLDAWVTLHSEKFPRWIQERRSRMLRDCPSLYSNKISRNCLGLEINKTHWALPGQAEACTSGFFAAKVAMYNLGCDRVVLVGIPLSPVPHFFDREPWQHARKYLRRVATIDREILSRMRSMSGGTRDLLGAPTREWVSGEDSPELRAGLAAE